MSPGAPIAAATAIITSPPDEQKAKQREEVLAFIATSIDANERSAFTEALESNRDLVERESDPIKFLQFENGSVEAAAKRLVAYWEERKEVFADRFLLPLVITGEGALDESSIAVLSTGLMVFLPDDAKGRSVLYLDYDVDRANGLFSVEKRTERGRLRFYMMHRAAERGRPLVCVRYSQSTNMDKVKMLAFQRFVKVFPVVLDSMMLVFHSPPGATRVFTDTVIPLSRQYLKDLPETTSLHPVLGSTSQELFAELKKFSFVAKGLPEKLGGTWTWDTFQTWLKARRDIESMGDSKPSAVLAAMPSSSSSSAMVAGAAPPFGSIAAVTTAEDRIRQAEERRNRKRQKDLEYSRERRNREKDEYDLTQGKVDALRKTQTELKEEEVRLMSLLADALDQVDIHLYGKPTMARSKVATSAPSTESTTETASEVSAQRTSTDATSVKNKKASASKDRHKKKSPRRGSSSLRTSGSAEERREADAAAEAPALSPTRDAGSLADGVDDSNAAGSKVGALQDMFPLGSLQADRLHGGVPALGMPPQNNDHLLVLLLQQQRTQQAQGKHLFASQLHPLDQFRLQQEQARGFMLGQYGMAAPAYGVPIYLAAPPRALHHESATVARNEYADLAALRSNLERRLASGSAGLSSASSAAATNPSSLGSQLHMLHLLNRQQPGTHPMQQVLPSLSSSLLPPGMSYPGASVGPSVGDAAAQGIDALLLQRYKSNRDG